MAAGAFQWTNLKYVCLNHCRSPLSFLMNEWREGSWGALSMGVRHGTYCLGCCWMLMGLLFVLGVMNLLWIAALAGFVLLEKVVPAGQTVSRATGLLLIGWGALMGSVNDSGTAGLGRGHPLQHFLNQIFHRPVGQWRAGDPRHRLQVEDRDLCTGGIVQPGQQTPPEIVRTRH